VNAKAGAKLLIAERALLDIAAIEAFSFEKWGQETAARYLADLESGLARIRERPELLRPVVDFPSFLTFYRVNKHLLVCDVWPEAICLLTVIHASRDIPNRLAELAPGLVSEVELLHEQLRREGRR